MALHNYFVTINESIKGIFQGETPTEALDAYAQSRLFCSWEGREICTERKDDFGVWEIADTVQVTKRGKDDATELWHNLLRLEISTGATQFDLVYERYDGTVKEYAQ